jgi:hypothetical protein
MRQEVSRNTANALCSPSVAADLPIAWIDIELFSNLQWRLSNAGLGTSIGVS